jgi:hypothetical protein
VDESVRGNNGSKPAFAEDFGQQIELIVGPPLHARGEMRERKLVAKGIVRMRWRRQSQD